jgi:MSHA pilin protein MshD
MRARLQSPQSLQSAKSTQSRQPAQNGFTLIEVIFFIVVVGVGLMGVLSAFTTMTKSSADPVMRKQAIAVAESLLEEILLTNYSNPTGGNTGTVRANFDDVAQYHNYTSTGIVDKNGAAIAGLERYQSAVQVVADAPTLPSLVGFGGTATAAPAWRVSVSVTTPDNTVVRLVGYRACYVNDQVQCPL